MLHVLGQLKEHYQEKNPYLCAQFTKEGKLPDKVTGSSCFYYRVTGVLAQESDFRPRLSQKPRRQVWKRLNNQESIMHNQVVLRENGIYQQWIDRETYQKALGTIENNLIIPGDFIKRIKGKLLPKQPQIIPITKRLKDLQSCHLEKRPVIRFSGVYNNKSKDISNQLTDVSIRAYTKKKTKSPLYLRYFLIVKKEEKAEGIKIQLKNNGILEEEVVFPRKPYIETFYEDRTIKKEELDIFPLSVVFYPVCSSFSNHGKWTITVKSVENGEEKILINSKPVNWEVDI